MERENGIVRFPLHFLYFRLKIMNLTIHETARLKAIQKGDIKEFELLFREFYSPLRSFAFSLIKSDAEAEEIVQDIFYMLWKNRSQLAIHTSFSAYLYKAVHNNSLQFLRREKMKLDFQNLQINWNNQDNLNPAEVLQYNELNQKINNAIELLPESCKTIFKLNRFDGLKYSDVAKKLSISIKTVEANMTKALKHLKHTMDEFAAN